MLVQDLTRSPYLKLDVSFYRKLGSFLAQENDLAAGGRSTSGPTIAKYYVEWKKRLPDLGVRLDQKRTFDDEQKAEMHRRQNGLCSVCSEAIALEDGDGDHYPVPHALGGPTVLENGRLVHAKGCYPRGRIAVKLPSETDDD